MNSFKKFAVFAVSLAMLLAPLGTSATEATSGVGVINLQMNVPESLTNQFSVQTVSFTYSQANGGTATASAPIVITSSWSLGPGHPGGVTLLTWLGSSTAALSGPSPIASSSVAVSVNGGGNQQCNQTNDGGSGIGGGGAICTLMVIGPGPAPAGTDGRTNTHLLSMSGLGNLIPGNYTGVYNVETFIL